MDIIKIFFGIIILRVLFWLIKGYSKQPEKLQFFGFAVRKYPILLMNPVISIAMIVMAIIQKWSFDVIIMITIFGALISILEDIFIVALVSNFRTKDFKIDGKEITSDNSEKGNLWIGIFISGIICSVILYLISKELKLSISSLFTEYWIILLYIILFSIISIIKILVIHRNDDKSYDASTIFIKFWLRPLGLFTVFVMVSFLAIMPEIYAVIIFLITNSVVKFWGNCYSFFVGLPEKEQNLFIKKFKHSKHS